MRCPKCKRFAKVVERNCGNDAGRSEGQGHCNGCDLDFIQNVSSGMMEWGQVRLYIDTKSVDGEYKNHEEMDGD